MYQLIFPILLFILICISLFFAYKAAKIKRQEYEKTGKHPQGHYLGLGIAFGLVSGIPLSIVLGNIAFGPAVGLPIGVAVGVVLEKKHKKELRPMTEQEKKMKKILLKVGIGLLAIGIAVFAVMNFFVK